MTKRFVLASFGVFSVVYFLAGQASYAAPAGKATGSASESVAERGKYLVKITGCNDCHTAGYLMKNGDIPESEWLQGNLVGWKGPWGVTFPTNLRLSLSKKTEKEWVEYAKTLKARPPMPWYQLQAMTDDDLKAIYAYIRSLPVNPKQAPIPTPLPPSASTAKVMYMDLTPQNMPK